jgi:HD-GYP domain-containing protein (c-di-GMP phosphodiesterase class II)
MANHHKKVAYLAFRLADQMNLPADQQKDIFLTALIHDIGALSKKERLEIIENEPIDVNNHAFKGARLLDGFKPMQKIASIIKFHHLPWNNGKGMIYMGEDVPYASHVIHVADRVCARIKPEKNILAQVPEILNAIDKGKDCIYEPNMVNSIFEMSRKEYLWFDLASGSPTEKLSGINMSDTVVLEIDDIIDLASIFSNIIDFRSEFTARHSAGVAAAAEKLALITGFSPTECKMMRIAGYLHDLGKIAIDNAILDKPGKLDEDEFNQIRLHTYYTYHLLDLIPEFKTIKTWAAYHHEKLNGSGYPFHLRDDSLPLGSRIMAVADIFTALTENRPYRKGMDSDSVIHVLNDMAANGLTDGKVTRLLIDNFQKINSLREHAQEIAFKQYEGLLDSPRK